MFAVSTIDRSSITLPLTSISDHSGIILVSLSPDGYLASYHSSIGAAATRGARVDGYTVEYVASDMVEAYKLIRLMYKYVSW